MSKIKSFVIPVEELETVRRLLEMFPGNETDTGKPDVLKLEWHDENGAIELAVRDEAGTQHKQKFTTATLSVPVLFFEAPGGVCFMAGAEPVVLELPEVDLIEWHRELSKRNSKHGFNRPQELQLESGHTVDEPRLLKLPNNPAERDMHRALSLYPAWGKNENLCTRYHEGREKTTVVFQPPEILQSFQEAPEKALRALDERFSKIKSEATADVIDILFHHWKANKTEAQGGRAAITLRRVCEYRGVIPKGDNLDLHWRAMRDARAIRLTGGGVDAALFDMDSFNLFGADETPDRDTGYFYQPGFLIQYGLENNRLYDADFLENIWRLDPYRNTEAKRLARFLRGEWRLNPESYLNPKPNGRCWRSWRELLAEAGQFPDQWDSEDRNTARKIKGIEKAINTLYDLEFLAETGTAIYHPEDRRLLDKLPRKGRLKAWLELRVCLLPAADIREALEDVSARRINRRERDAKALADAKARAIVGTDKPRRRPKSDAQK